MDKNLNQFYTKPEIAKRFVNKVSTFVDFDDYDNIIEPSAGSGRLLDFMPERSIGLDLDPKRDDIIKTDFFDYKFPKGKTLVIGNPPFGKQSQLANMFFNRCALYADVIAFIVPRIWTKYRVQNQLNKEFGLYWSCILPDNSFTFGNKDHSVKCVAQLWSKYEPNYFGGFETWNEKFQQKTLDDIDEYLIKNNIYEKPTTLF